MRSAEAGMRNSMESAGREAYAQRLRRAFSPYLCKAFAAVIGRESRLPCVRSHRGFVERFLPPLCKVSTEEPRFALKARGANFTQVRREILSIHRGISHILNSALVLFIYILYNNI